MVKTLQDLHEEINKCSVIFLGTTKLNTYDILLCLCSYLYSYSCLYSSVSSLFFREGCLSKEDSRVRKVPLFFRRPNLTEMNRVYKELVTVTVDDYPDDECKEKGEDCCVTGGQQEVEQRNAGENITAEIVAEQQVKEEGVHVEANPNAICQTDSLNCFWTSILTHDFPMIQALLLERPHYAYVWDEDGESPLHVAAKSNSTELISTLLECGCDPTVQDEQGRVAFSLASSKEAHQVFQNYRAAHPDQYVIDIDRFPLS